LTGSYGDRAWQVAALSSPTTSRFPIRGKRISALYPFIDGEVRYAVRHEYAQTAVDVIARRTRLSFLNAQAALEEARGEAGDDELAVRALRRRLKGRQPRDFAEKRRLLRTLIAKGHRPRSAAKSSLAKVFRHYAKT